MKDQKSRALDGRNNQRINKTDRMNNELTAAWTDPAGHAPESGVTIPSGRGVENAKDWVDNGSRL